MNTLFKSLSIFCALATAFSAFGDITVSKAMKGWLKNTDYVVTNVTGTGGGTVDPTIITNIAKKVIEDDSKCRTNALFIIRMNGGGTNVVWRDIELKATTNNFESEPLFFAGTVCNGVKLEDLDDTEHVTNDWCKIFVLSKTVDEDVRRWTQITNTSCFSTYKPGDLAILVDPALFRRGNGTSWCNEANEDLIWSFTRISTGATSNPELDMNGQFLWRPIMPVKWIKGKSSWIQW